MHSIHVSFSLQKELKINPELAREHLIIPLIGPIVAETLALGRQEVRFELEGPRAVLSPKVIEFWIQTLAARSGDFMGFRSWYCAAIELQELLCKPRDTQLMLEPMRPLTSGIFLAGEETS